MSEKTSLTETTTTDRMRRQALQSKLKGVNNHLQALIQKKLRLDLEIRRTKKRLTKLRNQSKVFTQDLSPKLESVGTYAKLRFLAEATSEDVELLQLLETEKLSTDLIEAVTDLEPVLYKNDL